MWVRLIFLISLIFSNVIPPLIKIPFFAARPIPTITAVGVASPIAQGHETTRTAIDLKNASTEDILKKKYEMLNVAIEIKITTGTNMELTLSPNFCISG